MFIINVIIIAVISGIVIDTFSDMRAQDEFRENDSMNRCFICCEERDKFNRLNLNFEKHQEQEHNIDNYI